MARNLSADARLLSVLGPLAAGAAAESTGAIVDMANFQGCLFLSSVSTAITGGTVSLTVTGADATSGPFTTLNGCTISSTAAGRLLYVDAFKPLPRYLRPVLNRATTGSLSPGVLALAYGHRTEVDQASTDAAGVLVAGAN